MLSLLYSLNDRERSKVHLPGRWNIWIVMQAVQKADPTSLAYISVLEARERRRNFRADSDYSWRPEKQT